MLERKPDLSEFGAGIQAAPNRVRMLRAWGLAEKLGQIVFVPQIMWAERMTMGERIGRFLYNKGKMAGITYGDE